MPLITQPLFTAISQHAMQCYPQECCGFLLGYEKNNQRFISDIISCKNEAATKQNRFVISADEYKRAEQKAEQKKQSLLGIYHSHPDCAAIPSATDLKAAFPYFSYLILSVSDQKITSSKCWALTDDLLFTEEEITIDQNIFSKHKPAYGNDYYSHTFA